MGAALEAGGAINITTGGDFSVQAAIDSQRRDFFSTNTGLVLMTTVQENSFVETAVLSRLLAGQGLNLDIGGNATLTLYDQAGVDAQLPEDLYPEELLALEGLQLLSQDLANEYFYDETVALSPAFKALVSIAIAAVAPQFIAGLGGITSVGTAAGAAAGTTVTTTATAFGTTVVTTSATGAVLSTSYSLTAIGSAASAFASSFVVESVDGAISGDYDLGEILKGATFSAASAGLTSGIDLDTLNIDLGEFGDAALLGFGNGGLTMANILEGALDGAIHSGLSSAVYGTDFGSAFSRSLLNTVVNLTLADVQFQIGSLGENLDNWEGSPGHMLLHGLAGCAAASAGGNSCAAGAAGAVAQSLYAGALDENLTVEQRKNLLRNAEVLGALAGFVLSGGRAENVTAGSNTSRSGFANNYLSHSESLEQAQAEALCKQGDQSACQRAQALEQLDQSRDDALMAACSADIHGAGCKAHMAALMEASISYQAESTGLYGTKQEYLDAVGEENVAALMAEYNQVNQMLSLLSQDPELAVIAATLIHRSWAENQSVGVRVLAGIGSSGADAIRGVHQLAAALVLDPGSLADAVSAIVDDPSLLPEAVWEPFKIRIDAGDYAGAGGYALLGALDAVLGTKGAISGVKSSVNAAGSVVDLLKVGKTAQLIDDLVAGGTWITPENVVDIRSINGRTVWLETGNSNAGLRHIVVEHGSEFAQRGISEAEIPDVLFTALQRDNVVGYQGRGNGRPIYEFEYGGQMHRLAITVGDNGFVVGANLSMIKKHKRMKLMAEVQCWAIWDMDNPDNIDPATLPLPKQLVDRIDRWSDKFDAIYELDKRNFHTNIAFASQEEEDAFYDEGWAILKQLEVAMPGTDWWYRDKRLNQLVQSRP